MRNTVDGHERMQLLWSWGSSYHDSRLDVLGGSVKVIKAHLSVFTTNIYCGLGNTSRCMWRIHPRNARWRQVCRDVGSLHIQMALRVNVWDLLQGFGCSEVLSEARIAKNVSAGTPYLHQGTYVVLDNRMKRARKDSGIKLPLATLNALLACYSLTGPSWLLVHKYQYSIFMFIHAYRWRKFKLCLSHWNVSHLGFLSWTPELHWWISIFNRDLDVLHPCIQY